MNTRTLKKHLDGLKSPDMAERRNSAIALAEADERAIHPLIKALRDESPGVQDAARSSLIEIGGETVAFMVLPLLRLDPYLGNTALLVLKALGGVSVPLLYPLLEDKDEDVRKFAVDLLMEIKVDVLPEKIVPLLKDTNANVRSSAARAVGVLGYREALPEVMAALSDTEWVSFSVLETLGDLKDESTIGAAADFLRHDSPTLRLAAIEALGNIGSDKASGALLKHVSSNPGAAERPAAIKALVQIGLTPSMAGVSELLLDMLRGGDWDDRFVALGGLVDLGEAGATYDALDIGGSLDVSRPEDEERYFRLRDALIRLGCSDELGLALMNPNLRYRGRMLAADVIGQTRCVAALPRLEALLQTESRDVRRACIEALGRMVDIPDVKEMLLPLIDDRDSHVRKSVARALGRLRDKGLFDLLIGRLSVEPYDDVLEEVVRSLIAMDPGRVSSRLSEFGSPVREAIGRFSEDADTLIRLSGDPDQNVRLFSLAGLGRLDEKVAQRRLVEALRDEEPEMRRTAIIALSGRDCCYSEIQSMLGDEDMWVRLHAVRALGASGMPEFLPVLQGKLRDKDIPVVMAAIESISLIGGEKAEEILTSLSRHAEETVREAAQRALGGF